MAKKRLSPRPHSQIPERIKSLIENPPLLPSEDRDAYFRMFWAFVEDIKPNGAVEWFWLNDIVYHTQEILRLRMFKTQVIELKRNSRAQQVSGAEHWREFFANGTVPIGMLPNLVRSFAGGNPAPGAEDRQEAMPQQTSESDQAVAFHDSVDVLMKIDTLLASVERRRDNILREIEIRREILARRLRESSNKLIEAKDTKRLTAAE